MRNSRCEARGEDAAESIDGFLEGGSAEVFWENLAANLEAGRLRLVFVSDVISLELQRIVEFLNEQMRMAQVLAIEVKQFVGDGVRALVPRVLGQTGKARAAKSGSRREQAWDRESFLQAMDLDLAVIAARLMDTCKELLPHWWWGRGRETGTVFPGINRGRSRWFPCSLRTDGTIEAQFRWLRERPPFDDAGLRQEFLARLNDVFGGSAGPPAVEGQPRFPMAVLTDEGKFREFVSVLEWFVGRLPEICT